MLCHAGGRDPLLPEDHEARDFLLDRLRAAGATPADAQKITALLVNRCREGARRVARAGSDARRDGDAHDVTLERFEGPGGVPRVRLSACGADVEIREGHLEKLRKLHGVAAGDSEASGEKTFVRDAFCVLCRYVGAQGGMHRIAGGHHTALHGAVFDVLRDTLGVEVECFASPLNCRWPSFCSGHADVDRPFGSLGSFFRFFPTEGAFECNPPFEESLMLRVAKHLTQLLDASTKLERALTFVVVVPHWPKRPAWEALHAVPHRARAEVIPLREHGYFEGAQHTKRRSIEDPPVTRPSSSCRPRRRPRRTPSREMPSTPFDARSRAGESDFLGSDDAREKVSKRRTRRFESSRTFLSCRHCIARTACVRFANPSPCLSCERLVSPPRRLSIPAAYRRRSTRGAILSSPPPLPLSTRP